jgi:signal transduction histidine kinase
MRLSELWRISIFRLTMLYGLLFSVGLIALLGMIYLQSAVYLTRRVDGILATEAEGLAHARPAELVERINEALSLDGPQSNVFALFAPNGRRLAGNLPFRPPGLRTANHPIELPPTAEFPAYSRLISRTLPSGEQLVVGRDINQLREMRAIIASALVWSGATTIVIVLGLAVLLSAGPLRRIHALRGATEDIAAGDLKQRMPVSGHRDELDMVATTVNAMMDEIERLLLEVRGVTQTIAHDLRTPLTRVRAQLHRLQQSAEPDSDQLNRVVDEVDVVLERFRALLRISELESRERHAAFAPTDLAQLCEQVVELYRPLAEAGGVRLTNARKTEAVVEADPKLLFEAVSNLVDNAIKFTGSGGAVEVGVGGEASHPRIIVRDNGPGVPESERALVLQRFYRSQSVRATPGSGLGLSIVAAITRLHRFGLSLYDADPGLTAVIDCRPDPLSS